MMRTQDKLSHITYCSGNYIYHIVHYILSICLFYFILFIYFLPIL